MSHPYNKLIKDLKLKVHFYQFYIYFLSLFYDHTVTEGLLLIFSCILFSVGYNTADWASASERGQISWNIGDQGLFLFLVMGDFHWTQLYFFHISHVQYVESYYIS